MEWDELLTTFQAPGSRKQKESTGNNKNMLSNCGASVMVDGGCGCGHAAFDGHRERKS